jgi:hypothetical protein
VSEKQVRRCDNCQRLFEPATRRTACPHCGCPRSTAGWAPPGHNAPQELLAGAVERIEAVLDAETKAYGASKPAPTLSERFAFGQIVLETLIAAQLATFSLGDQVLLEHGAVLVADHVRMLATEMMRRPLL